MINNVQIRVVFDRKNVATNKKTGLVQIEIRHNLRRKFFSPGIKVLKNQFKAGRIVNHEHADRLNDDINHYINEINIFVKRLDSQEVTFRLESIDNIFNQDDNGTFLDFMKRRINERPIKESTKKQHLKVLYFLKDEYKKLSEFSDLTRPNIIRLDEYLQKRIVRGQELMMQTTIHTYHKVIKIYINDAINLEILKSNPYIGWKDKRGCSRKRTVLSKDEIQSICEYKTNSILQAKVRDYFIIQCYTGLSYVDLMTVDFNKTEKIGNDYILNDIRVKTGTPYFLLLLPPVVDILNRYNWELPHLAYDVYNRWLKSVASAAGIKKTVTTHIGRHTFATTIALGSGLPIEVISKMLGHTNISTTQIYAHILPQSVLNGFHKIEDTLSKQA